MSLNKILDEQVITTNINAKDKNEALLILSEKLLSAGYINDINSFLEDIYYRESLGATGIGNYIAIPHGQSDSVLRNGIAIGKFNQEIEWETLDDKGVKLIFLFSVSANNDGANEHLMLLAQLAGKLGNDDVIDRLLEANDSQEIKQIFTSY